MKRFLRRWCTLALCAALWGPVAMADEGTTPWDVIQAIVEAVEEIVQGPDPGTAAQLGDEPAPPSSEIGDLFPPGG